VAAPTAKQPPLLEAKISLKFVGGGRVVAAQCGEVIGHRAAGDAAVVTAAEGRQTNMRGERDPHLETERGLALRVLLYLVRGDEAVQYLRAG